MRGTPRERGDIAVICISPLRPWSSIASATNNSTTLDGTAGPELRDGASLIPVTTGQGRSYSLLDGGSNQGEIWVLQLRPEGSTAASWKEKARKIVKTATKEYAWAQVKYYDTNFELTQVQSRW